MSDGCVVSVNKFKRLRSILEYLNNHIDYRYFEIKVKRPCNTGIVTNIEVWRKIIAPENPYPECTIYWHLQFCEKIAIPTSVLMLREVASW